MISIRSARQEDVEGILKFYATIEPSVRPTMTPEMLHDVNHLSEKYLLAGGNFWVVFDDDRVVGTVGLVKMDKDYGYLKRMYLDVKHRGTGLAWKLLHEVIQFSKQAGFKKIVLGTEERFVAALKFYEKSGFHKILYLPNDFPTYGDTLFYELDLETIRQ